jgi:biopolymer transport protein ExbB/TolQ
VKSLETAARVVAENAIFAAVSRLIMAIGVPLILASIFWVSSQLVALDRRVSLVEDRKPEMERRMELVERQNQRDIEEQARQTQRFGQIEAGIATLVAQQSAALRTIERVERLVDAQRTVVGRP